MQEVLVAVFNTVAQADKAVGTLEAEGVPASAIRRYHRFDPAIPQTGRPLQQQDVQTERQEPGFFAWLFGEEGATSDWQARDEEFYQHHTSAGDTVVAVTVEPVDSERVMRLLTDLSPIMLEETGTETGTVSGTTQPVFGTKHATTGDQTIPLAEEQVDIGKRRVEDAVQVRRFVVERPVEQQVNLRDERVVVERRKPVEGASATGRPLEERTIETRESHEVPVVSKTTKATEDVVVRKETGERTETVRDTARKEDVEVSRAGSRQ